jgi:UDP-3-O-[3-hydroxymyristoyl] glucosamine N-acyltransferase
VVSGSPAIPHTTWLRVQAALPTVPAMRHTIKRLEARIAALEQRLESSSGAS